MQAQAGGELNDSEDVEAVMQEINLRDVTILMETNKTLSPNCFRRFGCRIASITVVVDVTFVTLFSSQHSHQTSLILFPFLMPPTKRLSPLYDRLRTSPAAHPNAHPAQRFSHS